ncbi:Disease resistance protein RPM1 [Forsythia ovata]|uniref:Disease resistance protein RPM1 n=1 Tax=Forsythia ovata TaxID=205694 RepID=A0ABD1RP24_9LAMI
MSQHDMRHVRSFSAFNIQATLPFDNLLLRFRLLRMLELRNAPIDNVPKTIGVIVVSSISKLKNLQVVNCLKANDNIVRDIGNLTQLRRLELTNVKKEDGTDLCISIENLKSLHHLLLMASSEDEYLQIDQLSSTPLVLRKITLVGRLYRVPQWFNKLRNVIHLHLHWSQLAEDAIPYISELRVLERLTLINAYTHDKKQLSFEAGFSRLEDLYLEKFPKLVEIVISEGVMSSLARLSLHDCIKLKRVPQGIENLMNLKMLNLKNVSAELVESIRGVEGLDRSRARHIPDIRLSYVDGSEIVYENLS